MHGARAQNTSQVHVATCKYVEHVEPTDAERFGHFLGQSPMAYLTSCGFSSEPGPSPPPTTASRRLPYRLAMNRKRLSIARSCVVFTCRPPAIGGKRQGLAATDQVSKSGGFSDEADVPERGVDDVRADVVAARVSG